MKPVQPSSVLAANVSFSPSCFFFLSPLLLLFERNEKQRLKRPAFCHLYVCTRFFYQPRIDGRQAFDWVNMTYLLESCMHETRFMYPVRGILRHYSFLWENYRVNLSRNSGVQLWYRTSHSYNHLTQNMLGINNSIYCPHYHIQAETKFSQLFQLTVPPKIEMNW